jgi:hypothetical protein
MGKGCDRITASREKKHSSPARDMLKYLQLKAVTETI